MENTKQVVSNYFTSIKKTLDNCNQDNLLKFVELLLEMRERGGTVFIFGNGGSGATASHFAGDVVKGLSFKGSKRFKAICLNDNMSAFMAVANDISYDDVFVEQLKNFVNEGDLVVGISGSGNSINVVKAIEWANEIGVKTVALCGYDGGKIKKISHLALHSDINDMEVSEDIHLIFMHCVKRIITQKLNQV